MAAAGVAKQSDMMKLTGWSKAKMSQLYNGQQDFNSEILAEASAALNCEAAELLMMPERAFAIRRLRESAAVIVADAPKAVAPTGDRRTGTDG